MFCFCRWQTNSSKDTCTLLTFNLIASRDGEEKKEMATILEGIIYGNQLSWKKGLCYTNNVFTHKLDYFYIIRFSSTSVP